MCAAMACARMAVATMARSLSERGALIAWAVVAAIAIGWQLGGYPLLDADEGRTGEVGREMAATNDSVMPRLDGLPYLDKPIVYFAAEAATMEVAGPTETAARLPALLFTIATAAAAWWFARRLWGDAEAWLAFIATLASPLSVAFSRTVIFDSALAFFIVVAMMGFYLAIEADVTPSVSEGPGGAGGAQTLPPRPLAHARGDRISSYNASNRAIRSSFENPRITCSRALRATSAARSGRSMTSAIAPVSAPTSRGAIR